MATTVEEYIEKKPQWREALEEMRTILLDTELEEDVKWGAPMYTLDGKNIVGIMGFKSYTGLWFHMGALLKDPYNLLEQSEDTTQSLRKMMFHSMEEFNRHKKHIREYVLEAIDNQRAGKEIKFERIKELIIPSELQEALDSDPELKAAFERFTHGKKREFADHVSSAKQAATKQRRIEKVSGMILAGQGLHDKYR